MGSEEVIMRQLALFFAVLAVVTCYRSYHGYKVLRTEKFSLEMFLSLRLKQEISVTLCKLLTLSPSFHTASIHTPSFGSGLMATTMTHTPRTERSWSKWPLMPVMLYTLSMEQSLTQSTQLISTLLLELLMIGTKVFWDQDLLLPLNSETQADMDSCSLQIRLLNQEKKFGLPWM